MNKKLSKGRRVFWMTIFSVFFGLMGYQWLSGQQQIHVLEKQLHDVNKKYKHVQDQYAEYKQMVSNLHDEEYIGKLARMEYLYSEEGEVIFILPNSNEEN